MIKTDRNTDKIKMSLRDVRLSESKYIMTKINTEQNLKEVLSNALKNSTKEIKNQSSDITRMNLACVPYIQEQMKQGSNIKWTISEIQNKMKELVEYAPKIKTIETPLLK